MPFTVRIKCSRRGPVDTNSSLAHSPGLGCVYGVGTKADRRCKRRNSGQRDRHGTLARARGGEWAGRVGWSSSSVDLDGEQVQWN